MSEIQGYYWMKPVVHIRSHDLGSIAANVQRWWEECERGCRDADGEPLDWDEYSALNEERVEMLLREMLLDTHPAVLDAGGFRDLAIDLIAEFDEELDPQTYYIEYGVSAVYGWVQPKPH